MGVSFKQERFPWRRIKIIVNDFYSIPNKESKKELFSLTPSSKFILYLLKQSGPLSRRKIERKTLLPKRTIAYSLKILQEKDFIIKYKDEKDKRKSIFEAKI
ncbi:MAG: MarR family transcriptional regulator [Promethearchaeota archaeon]